LAAIAARINIKKIIGYIHEFKHSIT
jgi:hypothetical protein